MKTLIKSKYILVIIIIFGAIIRLTNITNNPPALYGDELTLVYDSYSLIKTGGYDSTGAFMPLTFSMGAGRPAGYVYSIIPFVWIFGPNALGIRLLSALSGIALIFIIYKLTEKLFNERVALISAFLTSVSIWDISLSRVGFEAHFALLLSTLGIYLLVDAPKRLINWGVAALLFGITLHTYPTYKLSLPLIILALFIYHKDILQSQIKKVMLFIAILGVFVGLSVQQLIFNNSEQRFSNINFLSRSDVRDGVIQKVTIDRNTSDLPEQLKSVFHNRAIEYSSILINSYLSNFSLDYLIFKGDGNPRHNPSGMGSIYYVELITLILGLAYLIRSNNKASKLLIPWLIIAPIPTSILLENHALRNSFMLPSLLVISSIGIYSLLETRNKLSKILFVFITLGIIWQFLMFIQNIFYLSPKTNAQFWSVSAKNAALYINQQKDKYDYILVSDRLDNIEYAYQVYTPVDPKLEIEQFKNRTTLIDTKFKKFDNVYIGGIQDSQVHDMFNKLNGKVLYVGPSPDPKLGYLTFQK